MRITFLTLFPEMYDNFLLTSIIGRAILENKVSVDFVNIRDFALDKYKHVDDTPYGGGAGMIMKCQPVLDALESVRTEESHVVLFAANGKQYKQSIARRYATYDHLILLCGHYKPQNYNGEKIPDVLASGNHENIRKWRRQQSLVMTREKRKDLFDAYVLTEEDKKLLKEYDNKNE